MFPFEEELENEFDEEEEEYYPVEYEIDFSTGKLTGRKVSGSKALAVWAYLALQIDRGEFYTYSEDYGCELKELIGYKYSQEFLQSEVKRMIKDCLTVNPYIADIENLEITQTKSSLHISFKILTDYGEEEMETDV